MTIVWECNTYIILFLTFVCKAFSPIINNISKLSLIIRINS